MAEPFLAEIRIFSFTFAPIGWAFCDGQLLPISQNTALFSLLGTTYGGDGVSTFGLPNLQGAAPMFWGQGPGLSMRVIGETGGESSVTLTAQSVPPHPHALQASAILANLNTPAPSNALGRTNPQSLYTTPQGAGPAQPMALNVLGTAGSSQPHNNMMPYLSLNFCIALTGIYPSRP